MSRRAGKAASRRARQRRVQRPGGASPAPMPPAEAAAAEEHAPARTVAPRTTSAAVGSQLTVNERSEYHYVERDLRDIGILTVVMAALLLLAWFVFSSLGLTG